MDKNEKKDIIKQLATIVLKTLDAMRLSEDGRELALSEKVTIFGQMLVLIAEHGKGELDGEEADDK